MPGHPAHRGKSVSGHRGQSASEQLAQQGVAEHLAPVKSIATNEGGYLVLPKT